MALLEAIASFRRLGKNTPGAASLEELTSALHVAQAHGQYASSVYQGNVFTISSSLIAAPAVISPLGAGAIAPLALWNPSGSGYIAVIRKVIALETATGTVSAKGFVLNAGKTNDITQATFISPTNNLIGGPPDGVMKGFTAVALTGSSALALLRGLHAVGNAVAQNSVTTIPEDLNDEFILQPGTVIAIAPLVAGTANEVLLAITYARYQL